MARQTGVSVSTAANLLCDSGVVAIGGTPIGATNGGAKFNVERTIREPEMDGQPGPVMGTLRIIKDRAVLTVKALELTQALIDKAIIGTSGNPEDYLIPAGSHADVTFVGKKASGSLVTVTLKNAICMKPEISMEDESEGGISMEFVACYEAGSDAAPWSIVAA